MPTWFRAKESIFIKNTMFGLVQITEQLIELKKSTNGSSVQVKIIFVKMISQEHHEKMKLKIKK